jgi:hypothetical protein
LDSLTQPRSSLPAFLAAMQAIRDLMPFCRALGGCSPRAVALEDARRFGAPLTIRNE